MDKLVEELLEELEVIKEDKSEGYIEREERLRKEREENNNRIFNDLNIKVIPKEVKITWKKRLTLVKD